MTMTSTELLALLTACSLCNDDPGFLRWPHTTCPRCTRRERRYRAALRRIVEQHAPGDEPHYTRNADWLTRSAEAAAHAVWQALTEVQAAILEELQR